MDCERARERAQHIIAGRAMATGDVRFARECLAGAWDETNSSSIKSVYDKLMKGESPCTLNLTV